MPELPEVETTRRCLEPLVGRRIEAVEVARDRMLRRQPRPRDFADRLTGRSVRALRRHGKFLLIDLDGEVVWVTHLGMSGRVSLTSSEKARPPHANVVVRFQHGVDFRLIDPRTFGFVAAFLPDEHELLPTARLGPDAYTEMPRRRELEAMMDRRSAPIKAVLLDQNVLAGIGNIYADESLHRARVAPTRPAHSLDAEEIGALRKAVRATLEEGLRHGGTSLDDLAYLLPDGRAGEYVGRLRAYGREGQPCRKCGAAIRRDVIRQRSAFWCPQCQI